MSELAPEPRSSENTDHNKQIPLTTPRIGFARERGKPELLYFHIETNISHRNQHCTEQGQKPRLQRSEAAGRGLETEESRAGRAEPR